MFGAEGGNAILTGDANILKRPHQLAAVHSTGLICVVLSKQWTQAKRHEQAANIIYWWPKVQSAIELSEAGDCWPIPFAFDKSNLVKKAIDYNAAARSTSKPPNA